MLSSQTVRPASHCDTLMHAGILVSGTEKGDIFRDYSLSIKDGIILESGPTAQMKATWQANSILDLADMLVMPGLVNSHTHAAMTFLRGLADDMPLLDWLEKRIFPVEARLTREISLLGSLLGYAEMLSTGTTACVDMYIFEDAVFSAAEIAGIRCMGGEAVFAFPSAACRDYKEALDHTRELARRHAGNNRLKLAVNPHSVYTTNKAILAACREMALELDIPLHIHLAESRAETESCLNIHGMRPVEWCEKNGLFDCRVIAAHLVDLMPDEISTLSRHKVCGIHNPSSNMKLASGISPVPAMLAAGMTLGLGTDGAASNNSLNLFTEMGRAALLHKVATGDTTALPAPVAMNMAISGGASIWGAPLSGRLTPGMAADCVALDIKAPNMQPMHSPVAQIVYAASGHECRMTMVEGEVLYHNGKFTRFDYEALLREAENLRKFASGKL